jgi:hypothetical protein
MMAVNDMTEAQALTLSAALSRIDGVVEAVVIPGQNVAYLKLRLGGWDEAGARQLLDKN